MALVGIAVGGAVYALVMPYLGDERKASERVGTLGQGVQHRLAAPRSLQIRKQQVQDTIKNIEAKKKPKKMAPLRTRLIRARLSMKPRTYSL